MANLLDVVPEPRHVSTHRYGKLEVTGLTVSGIAFLLKKHPEILSLFNQKQDEEGMNFDLQKVVDLGEAVLGDFLAAGLGFPNNEAASEKCRALNPEDTWSIGEAIVEETFPGGAANFFEKVAKAAKESNLIQASKAKQNEQEKTLS